MTIYTRYIGPTNNRGSRIKVWTHGVGAKTYSYPYEPNDPHTHCVLTYIDHYNKVMAEKHNLPPVTINSDWKAAETLDGRGYAYTNNIIRIEQ